MKKYLLELKEDTEKNMDGYSIDFVNDYSNAITSHYYLSDMMTEYADNTASIYYSDQFEIYEDNASAAEDALLELYDSDSIVNIIKKQGLYNLCCMAGSCYEYRHNIDTLYSDEDNIKKLFIINYLIDSDIKLSKKKINAILMDAEMATINRTSELKDIIDNWLEDWLWKKVNI